MEILCQIFRIQLIILSVDVVINEVGLMDWVNAIFSIL